MRLIVSFSFLILFSRADAFDRLYCQSNMKDWIVSINESTKYAVLTPYNQSVTLSEQQSSSLFVKDAQAKNIVTIFPWNSLYVRIPVETQKQFEIKSSESPNGFLVEVTDKKSKLQRSLNCRFTF